MVRNICPSIHFLVLFELVFKAGHSSFKKVAFICFDESPLKILKNATYFMLKTLLVLETFTILLWLFGYVEKWLDKKAKVNFKIYESETEQKIITIHILLNISRTKGNQTMKYGQSI